MTWPTTVDYQNALQHPDNVLTIPKMRGGQVERNALKIPKPRSGAAASVFKLTHGSIPHAVRLFLFFNDQREQHYLAVHQHLQSQRPEILVNFEYHRKGLSLKGDSYPVLLMDWVEGKSLGAWVKAKRLQRDLQPIRRMADSWVTLMRDLKAAKIAHGDLQHDNVMVVQDQLRLVDYDGMCVPGLVGHSTDEKGKPAYQHPRRSQEKLSLELDHFSAWVIYLALRVLASDPELIESLIGNDPENLLFQETDIANPGPSELWKKLLTWPEADIRGWAKQLRDCLDRPFADIPPFEVDPFAELRVACASSPRNDQLIARLGSAVRAAGHTLPADLNRVVNAADERDQALQDLDRALQTRDLLTIARAYRPHVLEDLASGDSRVEQGRRAYEIYQAIKELEEVQKRQDYRECLRLWAIHTRLLTGVPEARAVENESLRWQRREDRFRKLLEILPVGDLHEVADAWEQLKREGGHPEAAIHAARCELAVRRSECLRKLEAITGPDDVQDRDWLTHWDDSLLRGCPEADKYRERHKQAEETTQQFRLLKDAIDRELPTVAALSKHKLLIDYPPVKSPPFQAKINRVLRIQEQEAQLISLCLKQQPFDLNHIREIVALKDGPVLKHKNPPATCAAVLKRVCEQHQQVIDLEKAIAEGSDRAIAAIYNPRLLHGVKGCEPLIERANLACNRVAVLKQLHSLIDGQHWHELLQLWNTHENLLKGVADAEYARDWQRRTVTGLAIQEMLPRGKVHEIADAYRAAVRMGGHPLAQAHAPLGELAARQSERLRMLATVAGTAEEQDRQWLAGWDTALFEDCEDVEVKEWRDKVKEAGDRQQRLQELREIIEQAEVGNVPEQLVLEAAANLPEGYAQTLQFELNLSRERVRHHEELIELLRTTARSDRALARKWKEAMAAYPHLNLSAADQSDCEMSVNRCACLDQLDAIDRSLPEEEQDRLWLLHWNESLLSNCKEAESHRVRHALASDRTRAWQQLKAAIDARNLDLVPELAKHPLLIDYPPMKSVRQLIHELTQLGLRCKRLLEALLRGDPNTFEDPKDRDCLRDCPAQFREHTHRIAGLNTTWAISQARLLAGPTPLQLDSSGRAVIVRWTWKPSQGVSSCRVALNPSAGTSVVANIELATHQRTQGAVKFPVPPKSSRLQVMIWPVIDLGWISLTGEPLQLGSIAVGTHRTICP